MSPGWATLPHVSKSFPSEQDLLTTQQVKEMTGWSVSSINRWAARGTLPALKLPTRTGAYLFRREDVERHLASRRAAA